MTLTLGTRVILKDEYCDPRCETPVIGTVEDILDFEGRRRYCVMFDEETLETAEANGMMPPPGGEFSLDRLVALRS